MNIEDINIKERLLEIYPNGIVTGISSNRDIYIIIKKRLKIKNIDLKDYIQELGLKYKFKESQVTENNVYDMLLELYPDGYIPNVTDIMNRNQNIYIFINNYCNKMFIDKIDYIIDLGFKFGKNTEKNNINTKQNDFTITRNSTFDSYTLKELFQNYKCNKSSLAELLGTSKQNLDQKIKAKRLTNPFWQDIDFNSDEILIITNTIKKRELSYDDLNNKISIRIYLRENIKNYNMSNVAILVKNNEIIKCKFEFSKEINDVLIKYGYNTFEKKDIEILKDIYTKKELCEFVNTDWDMIGIKVNDFKFNVRLSQRAKELEISKADYMEYLGFKIINRNLIYNAETIKNILKEYLIEDNIVKIPINDPNYHVIVSLASRKGYKNLGDMITKLGFNYERIINHDKNKVSHSDIIKERYIVYDNKIYIPSQDPFYNRLSSYSNKKEINLDEYINSLGYTRIKSARELPKEYEPFDWKFEENAKLENSYTDEKIIELLDGIANEEYEIYLDTNSQIYFHLVKICSIWEIKIDTLLDMYGYKRIYKYKRFNKDSIKEVQKKGNSTDETEKKHISKYLKELEQIQYDKEYIKVESEKRLRNKKLVDKLKKLYHYKCQLCSNDENGFKTPIIEKEDGTFYIEVHHIEELSLEMKIGDDDINLDTYKNAIVLCCYHHKYVHYHLGGFKYLVRDKENNLFLQSKHGELLRIYTNHHLSSNITLEE